MKLTKAQAIARDCRKHAIARAGVGWALLGRELQWAMICEAIVGVVYAQEIALDVDFRVNLPAADAERADERRAASAMRFCHEIIKAAIDDFNPKETP